MKFMYICIIVKQTERIFIWICIICRQAACNVSYCRSLRMCGYLEYNQHNIKYILEM